MTEEVTEQAADRDEIAKQVLEVIVSEGNLDPAKASAEATIESLGIESIDVVTILFAIEEKFGVYIPVDERLGGAKTLDDIVEALTSQIASNRG